MSKSKIECKSCDQEASHPCWRHSKSVTGCRLVQQKWAPSRCRDCIMAIASMAEGSAAEKHKAFKAYEPFLRGLRSFVERVSSEISLSNH